MAIGLPTAVRNALADAFVARVDAGAGPGTIDVRTGGKPASPNDAATGTLLCTFVLADPSYGASANGVATLDATPVLTTVGAAAGTAGWWRMKDSAGNTVADGTAGGSGSGADMILDNPVIAIGQTINITAGTVTQPVGG